MPAASSDPRTGQLSLSGPLPATRTGQIPVVTAQPVAEKLNTAQIAIQNDPARRPDVLLRRRMPPGHQISAGWMIGAFVGVTVGTVALLNFFPI